MESLSSSLVKSTGEIIANLRAELSLCKAQIVELRRTQADFHSKLKQAVEMVDVQNPGPVENVNSNLNKFPQCTITFSESETQTSLPPFARRWNSDLSLSSLGFERSSESKRSKNIADDSLCYASQEAGLVTPVIRTGSQKGVSRKLKSKFTNQLDVSSFSKRPAENLLLADLGLSTQAPEFSQSEFNLSGDDRFPKESSGRSRLKPNGRVRFLSHDDGQSILKPHEEQDIALSPVFNEINTLGTSGSFAVFGPRRVSSKLSHSESWATLTYSEKDLSEADSTFSLHANDNRTVSNKGAKAKLRSSFSSSDLLQSKATQSMPNLEKKIATLADLATNKRHSMANMEFQNCQRRSSITGQTERGPYVPTTVTDLFIGGRVKALHGGNLIVTGVVWYRGRLPGVTDEIVGVELDQTGLGGDGTFQGHRYFRCAPGRGLFVPFRKIIMAWPPACAE